MVEKIQEVKLTKTRPREHVLRPWLTDSSEEYEPSSEPADSDSSSSVTVESEGE